MPAQACRAEPGFAEGRHSVLSLHRKLHCTRNYIHMNLFASFVLRGLAVLVKDIILYNSYSRRPDNEKEWVSYVSQVCPPAGGSVWVGGQGWGCRGEEADTGVSKALW